jgi:hypothetical protein
VAGATGLPSPTTICRIVDHRPSQPTSAAPEKVWPLSVRTVTPDAVWSTAMTFCEVVSVIRFDCLHAS